MKIKYIVIGILVILTNTAFCQYHGGDGDGWVFGKLIQTLCSNPENNAIGNGGEGDGFSLNLLSQTVCLIGENTNLGYGGKWDGSTVMQIVQTNCQLAENTNMSFGGLEDGFSFDNLLQSPGNCFPLPIASLLFNAQRVGDFVELDWTTSIEINTNYFQLYRSKDAKQWIETATKKAAGNSQSPIEYNHIDKDPFIGLNYYQLKQIDLDGQFSYSEIRQVYFDTKDEWTLYPNPAFSTFKLVFHINNLNSHIRIEINNAIGKIVMETELIGLNNESNSKVINCEHLESGIYFIKVFINKSASTRKLIIAR